MLGRLSRLAPALAAARRPAALPRPAFFAARRWASTDAEQHTVRRVITLLHPAAS